MLIFLFLKQQGRESLIKYLYLELNYIKFQVQEKILLLQQKNFLKKIRFLGDDMAEFLQRIPGVYFLLGASVGNKYPHHNTRFDFDEKAMINGVKNHLLLQILKVIDSIYVNLVLFQDDNLQIIHHQSLLMHPEQFLRQAENIK